MKKRIGLIGENSVSYIEALLRIWEEGACAVLIDWRIPMNVIIDMLRAADAYECYIDGQLLHEEYKEIEFHPIYSSNRSIEIMPDKLYEKFHENYSNDDAIILFSSGTTGKSKGIILSHYAIQTNADYILNYILPAKTDCFCILKSLAHSSTLIGELLVSLKGRIKLVVCASLTKPSKVLELLSSGRITTVFLNPSLLSLYLTVIQKTKKTLNCKLSVYVSGAILTKELMSKAKQVLPNSIVYNVYGLTEAGPRITAPKKGEAILNSVGKPLADIKIKILTTKRQKCESFEPGEIWVKTNCIFSGYVSGNRSKVIDEGWLNTKDIGYLDEFGNLFIVGRSDNMITIGSHNVFPEDIENIICENSNVDD